MAAETCSLSDFKNTRFDKPIGLSKRVFLKSLKLQVSAAIYLKNQVWRIFYFGSSCFQLSKTMKFDENISSGPCFQNKIFTNR